LRLLLFGPHWDKPVARLPGPSSICTRCMIAQIFR
jgi:hypothetical protein